LPVWQPANQLSVAQINRTDGVLNVFLTGVITALCNLQDIVNELQMIPRMIEHILYFIQTNFFVLSLSFVCNRNKDTHTHTHTSVYSNVSSKIGKAGIIICRVCQIDRYDDTAEKNSHS